MGWAGSKGGVYVCVFGQGALACPFHSLPPTHYAAPPLLWPPACLAAAAEASHMFALLMGDKVGPRRELIERHGGRLALEELDI